MIAAVLEEEASAADAIPLRFRCAALRLDDVGEEGGERVELLRGDLHAVFQLRRVHRPGFGKRAIKRKDFAQRPGENGVDLFLAIFKPKIERAVRRVGAEGLAQPLGEAA